MFLILRYTDVIGFIREVLHVEAPERLITFGVSGAFLYLATSVLKYIDQEKSNTGAWKFAEYTVRVLLALVVPIILVALFFSSEGKLDASAVSPELVAFVCGYSAKFVIEVMNKIVEKANTMVSAL